MSKPPTLRREASLNKVRKFRAIFVVVALLASALTTSAAGAQTSASEEVELERQEQELLDAIAQVEAGLTELDNEEIEIQQQDREIRGQIEQTADDLEMLALDRREPAIVRASLAIERFVSGDPAGEALAQELQAIGGSGSSDDLLSQQQVLGSIVESADNELTRIDTEIDTLTSSIPNMRSSRVELASRVEAIGLQRTDLETEAVAIQNRLAEVLEALEWFRQADTRSVLTGRTLAASALRPALVVKIDNVSRARPQSGINQADIVYVEQVEGGFTRLAAVFHSENVGTIGPVRSMRTTDINLLRPLNNPLFANSGGNFITTQAVNASSLVNIAATTAAGSAYFRNNSRSAPHNLYSTDSDLRTQSSAGGTPPVIFTVRRPGTPSPNNPVATNGVSVSYPNSSVSYSWNGSGWERTQDGSATVDVDGVRTAPETVIVRFTSYGTSIADPSSPEATTVGTGVAWIFTEGQLVEGTWSKPTPDSVTAYLDGAGNPVEILPGRVWVEIPEPGNASLR